MTSARRRSAQDAGFTVIELVVVAAIVSLLAALSASGLMDARAAANEAKAIQSMAVTSSAQRAYANACGAGAYAAGYLVLGQAPPGADQGFITMDLGGSAQPLKSGYRFTMTAGAGSAAGPNDCNGNATVTTFHATAIPLSVISGGRSFSVDANGTVWAQPGGTAPTEPLGPPAAPIR